MCFLNYTTNSTIDEQPIDVITILCVVLFYSSLDLVLAIKMRQKANPDYKILSPITLEYLRSKLPHKQEILYFAFTILVQMSFFFNVNLVWYIYRVTISVQSRVSEVQINEPEKYDIYNDMLQRQYQFFYFTVFLIAFELTVRQILTFTSLYQLIRTPPETERVNFLLHFCRKVQSDQNYVLESFLSLFCPQSGIRIFSAYFTYQQIFELTQGIFFELPLMVISLYYLYDLYYFYSLELGMITIQFRHIFLFLGVIKNLVKFCLNIYQGMTVKHPKILEQEFN